MGRPSAGGRPQAAEPPHRGGASASPGPRSTTWHGAPPSSVRLAPYPMPSWMPSPRVRPPLTAREVAGTTRCGCSSTSASVGAAAAPVDVALPAAPVDLRARRPGRGPRALHARPAPADACTPPALAARRGTAFHAWVEEHYSRAAFVDVDELPGSADDDAADTRPGRAPRGVPRERVGRPHAGRGRDERRDRRRRHRRAWPHRRGFEESGPDGAPGWVVVDWKTGPPPSGARAAARSLQLAAYRLAWARVRGVPEHRVRGAFFHAATGETVWPELPAAAEVTRVLRAARPAAGPAPG